MALRRAATANPAVAMGSPAATANPAAMANPAVAMDLLRATAMGLLQVDRAVLDNTMLRLRVMTGAKARAARPEPTVLPPRIRTLRGPRHRVLFPASAGDHYQC